MKPSELEPLPELAQSSLRLPNPEVEEEKEEALLPKKDLLDRPALIRRPSSSSSVAAAVMESDSQAPPQSEILIITLNPQDSSPSSSASSNGDDQNRRPNEGEDETPVQQLQNRRQQGGISRSIGDDTPKLEVKLGCSGEIDADEEDGMKTPTCPGSKIRSTLSCPAAPRKPASRPLYSKRKLGGRRVLFQDYSDEMQSLFSANLASDLAATAGSGGKIKKVRLPRP